VELNWLCACRSRFIFVRVSRNLFCFGLAEEDVRSFARQMKTFVLSGAVYR
jgi:hypothetical protein